MSKDDVLIIVIAAILLGAMILTFFFPSGKSRHGVGAQVPFETPEIGERAGGVKIA